MALILCPECKTEISDQPAACPNCGIPLQAARAFDKPTVGIVVAAILGAGSLLWSLSMLTLESGELALYALTPDLVRLNMASAYVHTIGNALLLIGVALTALSHRRGPPIVRFTCVAMLVATILTGLGRWSALSDSLLAIQPQVHTGLFWGIIAGIVGSVAQWGLIAFLFKKSSSW